MVAGAWAMADEASDKLRAAPPAVQVAVVQLVGTNKINDFDNEMEGDKAVFSVEFKVKGVSYEADIDPTGQILTREVEVDQSILPPAVIAAAKKAHADGKLGESSIITAGDKMFYEMDVQVGKDSHEMQIGAAGDVIADSIETPEADEADGAEVKDKGGKDDDDDKGGKAEKGEEHEDKD